MLSDPQILRIASAELDHQHGEESIPIGQHAVQATITFRLKGSVDQGAPQQAAPTVSLPLTSILALVCERAGVKADKMADLIVEAALEAFGKDEPVSEYLEVGKAAERKARALILEKLPPKEKRGPLRRILTLSDVKVSGAAFKPGRVALKRRGA